MSNWWDNDPIATATAPPSQGPNWWEADPVVGQAAPAASAMAPQPPAQSYFNPAATAQLKISDSAPAPQPAQTRPDSFTDNTQGPATDYRSDPNRPPVPGSQLAADLIGETMFRVPGQAMRAVAGVGDIVADSSSSIPVVGPAVGAMAPQIHRAADRLASAGTEAAAVPVENPIVRHVGDTVGGLLPMLAGPAGIPIMATQTAGNAYRNIYEALAPKVGEPAARHIADTASVGAGGVDALAALLLGGTTPPGAAANRLTEKAVQLALGGAAHNVVNTAAQGLIHNAATGESRPIAPEPLDVLASTVVNPALGLAHAATESPAPSARTATEPPPADQPPVGGNAAPDFELRGNNDPEALQARYSTQNRGVVPRAPIVGAPVSSEAPPPRMTGRTPAAAPEKGGVSDQIVDQPASGARDTAPPPVYSLPEPRGRAPQQYDPRDLLANLPKERATVPPLAQEQGAGRTTPPNEAPQRPGGTSPGSAPAPKPATPEARQPWEMTRDEYTRDVRAGEEEIRAKEPHHLSWTQEDIEDIRRAEVKQALKAGKPVPPEVLADYPDLKPPAPVEAKPTDVAAPAKAEGRQSPSQDLFRASGQQLRQMADAGSDAAKAEIARREAKRGTAPKPEAAAPMDKGSKSIDESAVPDVEPESPAKDYSKEPWAKGARKGVGLDRIHDVSAAIIDSVKSNLYDPEGWLDALRRRLVRATGITGNANEARQLVARQLDNLTTDSEGEPLSGNMIEENRRLAKATRDYTPKSRDIAANPEPAAKAERRQSRMQAQEASNPAARGSIREKRDALRTRIDAGKPVLRKALEPFAGEQWADDHLAKMTPARKPPAEDAMSNRRVELQNQLREQVAEDIGMDVLNDKPEPLKIQVMRGDRSIGSAIPLDEALAHAETLPDEHPAKITLHNLRELEKNPRGTKGIEAINTNDVEDGTRVQVNKNETLTINHSMGTIDDGIRAEIPEGGITLYGKKLPPIIHPDTGIPVIPEDWHAPDEIHGAMTEAGVPDERATAAVNKLIEENPDAIAQGPQPEGSSLQRGQTEESGTVAGRGAENVSGAGQAKPSGKTDLFGNPAFDAKAGETELMDFAQQDAAAKKEKAKWYAPEIERKQLPTVPENEADAKIRAKFKEGEQATGKIFGLGGGAGRKPPTRTEAPEPPDRNNNPIAQGLKGKSGFVKDDLVPTLVQTAKTVAQAKDDIQRTLAPQTRGEQARVAANMVRESAATLAQRWDRAEEALSTARAHFDRQKSEDNYRFIDDVENGRDISGPQQIIAKTMRQMLDGRRKEVQALGKGALSHFIKDYFPHIWKDPEKASEIIGRIAGKKPLEGPKSFLKQRTIPTVKEGLEAGLEPISDNPVDMVLLKVREMDRYILAHRLLRDLKDRGLVKFVRATEMSPEGYAKINDRMAQVYGPPTIKVNEWQDPTVYDALSKLARDLGIKHERSYQLGENGGSRALGLSYGGQSRIQTRHNTPESVFAHEISHQLDEKFNLGERFFHNPDNKLRPIFKRELRALADLRNATLDVPEGEARPYTRKREEQIAHILQAYIGMKDRFQQVAPRVFREFERVLYENPVLRQIRDIKPSLNFKKIVGEKPHGGLLKMGEYMAPESVANVLNNYLSPGLRNKAWFRAITGAGNVMNQAQLGMSAFHLGFTSMDAVVSKFALGLEQLSQGQLGESIKSMATSPAAPITNFLRGNKVLKEWYSPGSQGETIAAMADAVRRAGGRVRTDSIYRTDATRAMLTAFRKGNIVGGMLRVPFAALDAAAKPVLEYIVPRQKLGIFADLAKNELGRLSPNADADAVRAALAKAWDSADNRMGQVVYDNLFWNKAAKDLAMASVRSLGWNLGTFREIGGGLIDAGKAGLKLATANRPEFTHRMAYTMALPIVAGIAGGMLHYAMTGKPPEELKDYFFPKTGGVDENGRESRVSLPTYMKDIYAYKEHPIKTLGDKLHPLGAAIVDMLNNRDYYGTEIRNADDPIIKQAMDLAKFAGKQFVPFGVQGYAKMTERDESTTKKLAPFIGITPAPSYIDQTDAEKLASSLMQEKMPAGTRTQAEADRGKLRHDLARAVKKGDPTAREQIRKALADKLIFPKDVPDILRRSKETTLVRQVEGLDAEDSMKVWRAANDDERRQIISSVRRKLMGSRTITTERRKQLLQEVTASAAKKAG